MKNILMSMVFVVVAFCATNAWAGSSRTVTVNATVPTVAGGLTVEVSKVTGEDASGLGGVWTTASSISFGTLVWDSVNSIFLPDSYYAVDIGVLDNSGNAWTVTHSRQSLANGANNLNDKVNVSFNKQTTKDTGIELSKFSFGNSNSKAFTKAQLTSGWLRVYYGIGTGNPLKPDASGVTPIGLDTPAGTYNGSITITLAP